MMRIVLVCNSDARGGAAVVTRRLMHALVECGADASMLVMNKTTDDPRVHRIGTTAGRKLRFFAERGYIFAHNGFNRADLFKVSVANTGFDIAGHRLVKDADVVILSWVNQGMVSLNGVRRLVQSGKRVLWVMHDMWCLTGICHHAHDCDGYTRECGNCRYVKNGTSVNDLSHKVWLRKKRLYDAAPALTMIAVSNWLAGCARRSSLLGEHDVRVIPNAFPDRLFGNVDEQVALPAGVDPSKQLIVMGAARLDDSIKNLPLAVEALNRLAEERPDIATRCQAVFYGDLRDSSYVEQVKFPALFTGRIDDERVLRRLFAQAQVVMSTSRFETLPGTLIEGMASGCTIVTTGNGGQRDIVDDGKTGYIVADDAGEIAAALARAIDAPFGRTEQHRIVAERFGAEAVARQLLAALKCSYICIHRE